MESMSTRGPRGFHLKNLPEDCYGDITPDGDGTKVVLVDAAGDYRHGAHGIVAMVSGDITRWGGLVLLIINHLDTSSLGKSGDPTNDAFRALMLGLKGVAQEQRVVMFKGE